MRRSHAIPVLVGSGSESLPSPRRVRVEVEMGDGRMIVLESDPDSPPREVDIKAERESDFPDIRPDTGLSARASYAKEKTNITIEIGGLSAYSLTIVPAGPVGSGSGIAVLP